MFRFKLLAIQHRNFAHICKYTSTYTNQDIAEVTVQAPEGFAAPAVLFAAIYRDGKQVCIGSTITGLASGELKTASIELPYFSEEATTMKVFALLSDGLIPLCPAFTLSL